jgi:hypothetical protein
MAVAVPIAASFLTVGATSGIRSLHELTQTIVLEQASLLPSLAATPGCGARHRIAPT